MNVRLHLGDAVLEIVGVDEDLGLGVLDDADQFAPVKAPVEGGVDRAQFGAGEEAVQVLHPVAGQDGYPVAFADARHVPQPVGEAVSPLVHLAVGQPQLWLFAGVNDG